MSEYTPVIYLVILAVGGCIYLTFIMLFSAWVDAWMKKDHSLRYAQGGRDDA